MSNERPNDKERGAQSGQSIEQFETLKLRAKRARERADEAIGTLKRSSNGPRDGPRNGWTDSEIGSHSFNPRYPVSDRRRPHEDRTEQIDRLIHESYTLLLRAKSAREQAGQEEALISLEAILEQLKRCLDRHRG